MSMYLPNSDLQPTGSEMTEFIDIRPMAEASLTADGSADPRDGTAVSLDVRTRLDIARRAASYIAGLVEDHNGDPADVRTVIDELQRQSTVAGQQSGAIDGSSAPPPGPRRR